MFKFLFLLVGVAGVFALWALWKKFHQPKKTPQEKMQDVIDEQTAGLHKATQALRVSESYVRQIKRERDMREGDVKQLTAQVENLVGEGKDDEARIVIKTLERKESELSDKKQRYADALEQHQKNAQMVDQYRQNLRDLKDEASQLQVRLNLAEAEREAAALNADLRSGVDARGIGSAKSQLEADIAAARAEAEIDRELATNPEDEYLKADATDSVEDRLAKFKKVAEAKKDAAG